MYNYVTCPKVAFLQESPFLAHEVYGRSLLKEVCWLGRTGVPILWAGKVCSPRAHGDTTAPAQSCPIPGGGWRLNDAMGNSPVKWYLIAMEGLALTVAHLISSPVFCLWPWIQSIYYITRITYKFLEMMWNWLGNTNWPHLSLWCPQVVI